MNKIIGILAHVDSGKTTLCEQILYHTKVIRKIGRVDHKNSFFDNNNLERKRGITIFSKEGKFEYKNSNYYLIDTPGHIDLCSEMERSLKMLDYAILVISGVDKVQSHSETIFNLLKENNIPTFIFVNKMDRDLLNKEEIINNIKENISENVFDVTDGLKNGISKTLKEYIVEQDEILLEKYFNDELDYKDYIEELKKLVKELKVFPIIFGSALYDINIDLLLEILDELTYTTYCDNDDFIGQVYKQKYDDNSHLETIIKINSGSIKIKDEISYRNKNNEVFTCKINEIKSYNNGKLTRKEYAKAGEIVSINGIDNISVGEYIVTKGHLNKNIIKSSDNKSTPTLTTKVLFDNNINIKDIYDIFKMLNKEDPSLNLSYNEDLKEISISIMGQIQLEIIKEIVKERYNKEVDFGPCEVIYKETIEDKTIGVGHFEPLKHYAEVVLKIEPNDRNCGIVFESMAHVDDLNKGYQNLIKSHIFERKHKGILGGYEITDIKITLITGKAHNKHTEGGDFRQATYRAIRQGLENIDNILLEPYYNFKIQVENEYMGRVISDIQKMSGTFRLEQGKGNMSIIKGRGPVNEFINYPVEFISFTKGKGKINYCFDGYDRCHNENEILSIRNYNKDSDKEYTSNSIFCSKGESFTVKGKDIKKYMHCSLD